MTSETPNIHLAASKNQPAKTSAKINFKKTLGEFFIERLKYRGGYTAANPKIMCIGVSRVVPGGLACAYAMLGVKYADVMVRRANVVFL
ncbi:MAG: hypothetical protein KBA75_10020 [Alphaproteobacteria bacterium]|nr:hypothetical protein [Alphaproteobacteria bacterium]